MQMLWSALIVSRGLKRDAMIYFGSGQAAFKIRYSLGVIQLLSVPRAIPAINSDDFLVLTEVPTLDDHVLNAAIIAPDHQSACHLNDLG